MDKKSEKRISAKLILIIIIVLCLLSYFFIPSVKAAINNAISILSSADVNKVVEYIRSFGVYAYVISFLLMVFQSLAAPIPAFLITFANAIIFGWWKGAILSWTSSMVGAVLCFYIARILGRDAVVKLTSNESINTIEKYFETYGAKTILVCRLLPFVSFDVVSYFAGLTSISLPSFLLATGIGQLPATIIYSYVGGMLTGGARIFVTALLILFSLSIIIMILKQIFDKSKNKSKS